MTFSDWVAHLTVWDAGLAAIALVIGWAGKKVLDWLLKVAVESIAAKGLKGVIAAVFSRENMAVVYDLLAMTSFAFIFFRFGWTDDAVTGKDVAIMIGCAFMFLLFALYLSFDLYKAVTRKAAVVA